MTTKTNNRKAAAAKTETKVETPESKPMVIGTHKLLPETKLTYAANPKRKNSQAWARYEEYQKAQTVAEYLELNPGKAQKADLRHDFAKGFVSIPE